MNNTKSPKEAAEYAAKLKNSGRYNCCQAVLIALAKETSLDEETLRQLGAGFGAGMGTMENSCGALVGASMIMGLRTNGSGTIRYSAQLSNLFASKSGSVICKELKGRTTGKVLCPCDQCVRNAVLSYYELVK
ncbi:MAG: C_GCAxxG_C_C family protein [Clostridia bacterium]|nr:C_GCAxxG_C_C family protein [Clostridia bacterium]